MEQSNLFTTDQYCSGPLQSNMKTKQGNKEAKQCCFGLKQPCNEAKQGCFTALQPYFPHFWTVFAPDHHFLRLRLAKGVTTLISSPLHPSA
ncbi:MAG: hypothetical protein QM813_06865 [Verrucomicrobiota bacterium]